MPDEMNDDVKVNETEEQSKSDEFDAFSLSDVHPGLPPDDWKDVEQELGEVSEERETSDEQNDVAAEEETLESLKEEEKDVEEEEASSELNENTEEELAKKAEAWDNILSAWAKDPVGTITKFVENLDDDSKKELFEKLNPASTNADETVNDFKFTEEPSTEFEEVIANRKDWIIKGETIVENKITDALTKYSEQISPIVDNLWVLHAQNAALQAALNAVLDNIPEPDIQGIIEEVRSGKSKDFSEAAKKKYGLVVQKAAKVAKQATRPRPSTPRNESSASPVIREGMSMVEIAQLLSSSGNRK